MALHDPHPHTMDASGRDIREGAANLTLRLIDTRQASSRNVFETAKTV